MFLVPDLTTVLTRPLAVPISGNMRDILFSSADTGGGGGDVARFDSTLITFDSNEQTFDEAA